MSNPPYENTAILATAHALGLLRGVEGGGDAATRLRGMMHTFGDYAVADVGAEIDGRHSLWEFKRTERDVSDELAKPQRTGHLARLVTLPGKGRDLLTLARACHWMGYWKAGERGGWRIAFRRYTHDVAPDAGDAVAEIGLDAFCRRALAMPPRPAGGKTRAGDSTHARVDRMLKAAVAEDVAGGAGPPGMGVKAGEFAVYIQSLLDACAESEEEAARLGQRKARTGDELLDALGKISAAHSIVRPDGSVLVESVESWSELPALARRRRPPGKKPPTKRNDPPKPTL